jgi:hypothetical protein
MNETTFARIDFVDQAELIEQVLQRAVHRALSIHKRLGNPVALWTNHGLTVVPPDEIDLHVDLGDERLGLDDKELPEYFGDLLQYVQSVS